MSEPVPFDVYGFLNNQWPLNQTNWAEYFGPHIPDGVLGGIADELEPFASSSGMYVYIRPGECRVNSHHGKFNEIKALTIDPADTTYSRYDLVVARVTYASSEMAMAVKTGTPAASPELPALTQQAGNVWEIPLARVTVPANAATIAAGNVLDLRHLYYAGKEAVYNFSGTTIEARDHTEHRAAAAVGSLRIDLPDTPPAMFAASFSFSSNASFTGVTFRKGSSAYTPKRVGDLLTYKSSRYNLSIWWDGSFYWVGAQAA